MRSIEVGTGYGNAHDIEFEQDGSLLVAGDRALYRVTLAADRVSERRREVVLDGLPTGGHSTKTVEVLPDGELLLSIGSSCDVCIESGRAACGRSPWWPRMGEQRI